MSNILLLCTLIFSAFLVSGKNVSFFIDVCDSQFCQIGYSFLLPLYSPKFYFISYIWQIIKIGKTILKFPLGFQLMCPSLVLDVIPLKRMKQHPNMKLLKISYKILKDFTHGGCFCVAVFRQYEALFTWHHSVRVFPQ